jgi:hypothetical protein
MSTQVYEEVLNLEVEQLEATPLLPKGPHREAYPFPYLTRSGNRANVETPVLTLENDFLLCQIAPTLGGRIVHLLDKRTGAAIIPEPKSLDIVSAGPRGAECRAGLRWRVHAERLNDLGPVDFQVIEPSGEDDPAGVWLHELVQGSELSVHVGIFLAPGVARINFELRTFNRSFEPILIDPCFLCEGSDYQVVGASRTDAAYSNGEGAGLAMTYEPYQARGAVETGEGAVRFRRFPHRGKHLAPRQLDTWKGVLVPISGLSHLDAIGEAVALAVDEHKLSLQVSQPLASAKLVVQHESGAPVEARIDAKVGETITLDLPRVESGIRGIALIDSDRNTVLQWEPSNPYIPQAPHAQAQANPSLPFFAAAAQGFSEPNAEAVLINSSHELGLRSASFSGLGILAARKEEFEDAAALFDDSLLYNAEDHLTWWAKAAVKRHLGEDEEECHELLNAHYLAPLEPVLRAEAFFRQPASSDGQAFLKRYAEDPGALIEVACLLYETRLFGDLERWAAAALGLRNVAMLRYIRADAMIQMGTMLAEAAGEISAASKLPINPPYPWRNTELAVLERLSQRFSNDKHIAELLALGLWGKL